MAIINQKYQTGNKTVLV